MEQARTGFDDSTWPYPYSDLWRSSAASGVGLPADVRSDDLTTASAELGRLPFFGVTNSDGNLFVLGGSPFLLDLFTEAAGGDPPDTRASTITQALRGYVESDIVTPYVARIEPDGTDVATLELPRGKSVNYIGGLLAHENGKIYAVAMSTLFEIDPGTLEVSRSLELPLIEKNPKFTSYNGLQVNPRNGDIILKASDFAGSSASELLAVRVDTNDLAIRTSTQAHVGTSRMTIAIQGDTEYLYIPSATTTERYAITDQGFDLDRAWSKTYRSKDDGSVQATSMLNMGDLNSVVFADNDTIIYGVTAPLRIFSQSTTSTTSQVDTKQAVSTDKPGGTFYMVTGDPFRTGIVVAQDAVNDILAGWQVAKDGSLTKLWETSDYKTSAGPAIAVDQGHLYVDDLRCDEVGSNCRNHLVILDLETADEIADVEVDGQVASLGQIFFGADAAYFISSEQGRGSGSVTVVKTK